MASTRLLLEGSDIESLLAQVRDQYGDAARIVSADKVRSGGIGGFFSKEKYELSVEIDEAQAGHGQPVTSVTSLDTMAPPAEPIASPPAPGWPGLPTPAHERAAAAIDSVQALLDLADHQENQLSGRHAGALQTPATLPPLEAPAAAPVTSPYDAIRAAEAFSAASRPPPWAHTADAQVHPEPPAIAGFPPTWPPAETDAPQPSTSGPEFAEILAGLRHDIAAPPVTSSVRPFRPADGGGADDTFTLPSFPVEPPADHADDPFPSASAILGESLRAVAGYAGTYPQPGPLPPFPPTAGIPPVTRPAPVAPILTPEPAAAVPAEWAAPASSAPAHAAPAYAATVPDADPLVERLVQLGLPANLAQRAIGRDPYSGIVRALGLLPAPAAAPTAPGEVLVVAGELSGAMVVAKQACKRMRIDPASILVVGPTVAGTGLHSSRRMSGAPEAGKRAPKLHAADVPHVVVIDAPLEGDTGRWVRTVTETIGATAVWAVVDATRKTADVARQLRGFGMVDAIAVHGATATGDPASVLSLGVPVASLDGRKATPQAWAALLCDLLEHLES